MNKFLLIALALLLGLAGQTSAQLVLNSPWAANNGQSGVTFDVNALQAVDITDFEHNLDAGTWDIEIYTHNGFGTYLGNQAIASAWTLVHSQIGVVGNGSNLPSTGAPLLAPISIPAGQIQGLYITCTNGTGMNYQNGIAVGNVWAADAFMEIHEGHGGSYPFGGQFSPRNFSGAIHYAPGAIVNDDLALNSIDAPASNAGACGFPLQAETVTVTVMNFGQNAVLAGTAIPISYTLDDGVNPATTVNETFTPAADIPNLGQDTYSFAALAALGSAHAWTITATVSMPGDADPSNDSKSGTIANGLDSVSAFPWTDDMETATGGTSVPTGWTNSQSDNPGGGSYPDWLSLNTNSTPSGGTGPAAGDHTSGSGYYVHVEDSGSSTSSHSAISLITPCLDLSSLGAPQLRFWLCSNNNGTAPDNLLEIDVIDYSTGSGVTIPGIAIFPAEADQAWYEKTVDLSAFAGNTIQVVFRGRNDNGTFSHDVCIDDVKVFEPTVSAGQAAQAGLAELDINGATNANGDPVGAYTAGPHSTDVTSGAVASFSISGAAGNNAIILLTGPLNVAAGSAAGIGQFDIGVSSGGGVPTGISIVVDGTNASGAGFWSSLFHTGAGTMNLDITYNIPAGISIPFQAVVFSGTSSVAALSNAVEVNSI